MTLAFDSLCFETNQALASSWVSAYLRCVNSDFRLPSMAELGMIYRFIVTSTIDETDWTDEATSTSNHYAPHLVGFVMFFDDHPNSDSIASRCVTTPHNNLGPSPLSPTAAKSSFGKARPLKARTRRK